MTDIHLAPDVLARISLAGMALELLGGCYLAYDLLGGRNGPLRSIARATGYLPLFLGGYWLLLGLPFALIGSVGMAALLAVEFHYAAKPGKPSRLTLAAFGLARGLVLGAASVLPFGPAFAGLYAVLTGIGLAIVNALGLAPADDYESKPRPGLRPHNLLASAVRAMVALAASVVAVMTLHTPNPFNLVVRLVIAVGMISTMVGLCSPAIERFTLEAPERRLGLIGLGFILGGTLLDSLDKWQTAFGG